YDWLLNLKQSVLAGARRHMIVTRNDELGRALRHTIAAVFGSARTWFMAWRGNGPQSVSDLLNHPGKQNLKRFIDVAALPFPANGLYTLDEMPEPPKLVLWETGFDAIGSRIRLAPTMLSVVSGFPGHGKSALFSQIWFQIARRENIRVVMFSAETRVKPHLRRIFRECYHQLPQWRQTPEMQEEADNFIRRHFLFLEHPAETPTMDWLVDMIEAAALRHACRAVVIDPWNKIEADYDPRAMTETAWIGQCLDRFIHLARSLNIHIQIIAHPAKPESAARKFPPDLYSISGSSHWNNRVDQGFVVWREKMMDGAVRATRSQLICLKARFQELGYPSVHELNLDLTRGVFECVEDDGKQDIAANRGDDGHPVRRQNEMEFDYGR
ncbi:MAG TPA: hypothetical protein DCO82_08375, partial [Alphaproteobacteria bacterium]|nr:hypothetical protein [Alphaproteobacteria bacterium]